MGLKWHERGDLTLAEIEKIAELVVEEGRGLDENEFGQFLLLFLRSRLCDESLNYHEREQILRAVWDIRG